MSFFFWLHKSTFTKKGVQTTGVKGINIHSDDWEAFVELKLDADDDNTSLQNTVESMMEIFTFEDVYLFFPPVHIYTNTDSSQNRTVWTFDPYFDPTTCVSCVFRQHAYTPVPGSWGYLEAHCCLRGDLLPLIVSRRQIHQLALCWGTELCPCPRQGPIGLV